MRLRAVSDGTMVNNLYDRRYDNLDRISCGQVWAHPVEGSFHDLSGCKLLWSALWHIEVNSLMMIKFIFSLCWLSMLILGVLLSMSNSLHPSYEWIKGFASCFFFWMSFVVLFIAHRVGV